ncbi:MAG: hypothetical protein IT581_14605 [Verrucomicrobiales bacterium]|nr:hypothetical protein [Verrucomicrobiales bacterium]
MRVTQVLLFVAGHIFCSAIPSARAAEPLIVTVTSTADNGPGTLRAAMEAVNDTGQGEIDLRSLTGLIALETRLPEVRANLRLIGPEESAGRLLISGQGAVPILSIAAGTTSEVTHLTLTNAFATNYHHGAAISNAGVLVLRSCELSGNRNQFGWGGAIYNEGDLTLESCSLRNNQAIGEPGGGANFNTSFTGTGPGGGGAGFGGAIFQQSGRLSASHTTFEQNQATGGDGPDFTMNLSGTSRGGGPFGGVPVPGPFMFVGIAGGFGSGASGCFPSLNGAGGTGGFGGGHTRARIIQTDDRYFGGGGVESFGLAGSGAGAGMGGALFVRNGTARLDHCLFATNSVKGGTGGSGLGDTDGAGESGGGHGGAILIHDAAVEIDSCQIIGNTASGGAPTRPRGDARVWGGGAEGAGIFLFHGSLQIKSSRLTDNRVEAGEGSQGKNGGYGADGRGAGISVRRGNCVVDQCLFNANETYGGKAGGGFRAPGNAGSGWGGALFVLDGSTVVENSTLSGNRAAGRESYDANLGFGPGQVGASLGGGAATGSQRDGERKSAVLLDDFLDAYALAKRVIAASDPVSQLMKRDLPAFAQEVLANWNGAERDDNVLQTLASACNNLLNEAFDLKDRPLWNTNRFASFTLRPETLALAETNPTGAERSRLNRLLLEDVYPRELVRIPLVTSTQPSLTLRFCTVTSNELVQAYLDQLMFPRITNGVVNGGGLYQGGGTITLEAVICAGNRAVTNTDVGGSVTSVSMNLVGDPGSSSGWQSKDLLGANPNLGPLQDNGGPTWTHALLRPSPAIDRLSLFMGPRWDQRGYARPIGGEWDLGAVEAVALSPSFPRLERVGLSPQREIQMQITGLLEVQVPCRIEFSTDLVSWEALRVIGENEVVTRATSGAGGYFRVVCSE